MRFYATMIAAALGVGLVVIEVPAASAAPTTWSATETIPVPPASTYQGSGGGDGWAVALTADSVYNVFHHSSSLRVACHRQVDASPCYPTKTINDAFGFQFQTSNHPGLWLDQGSEKLFVYATRASNSVAGVVCIDTNLEAATNPFCGFVELTGVGEANGAALSAPVMVGSRWYAFNLVGGPVENSKNKLLCFDTVTLGACVNQPFALTLPASGDAVSAPGIAPIPAVIDGQIIVPVNAAGGSVLACYSPANNGNCGGLWPTPIPSTYLGRNGAPYPMLSGDGSTVGVCLPASQAPCFDLTGAPATSPAGIALAVPPSSPYSGQAVTIGPRVYVPNGDTNNVHCYNFSAQSSCSNFPKSFANLGYLYTVNADPARPTCLWVNADNGTGQIQNFDAYSGGGCGEGPIRVLASQLVAAGEECTPTTYSRLQVLDPTPDAYGSGAVSFADGDANPIPGVGDLPLDSTGAVNLAGLNLDTAAGLPQFLITLNDPVGGIGEVTVRLTWTGENLRTCNPDASGDEPLRMVALGDSYTSGEGTSNYDTHNAAQKCHRGPDAWPRIVEQKTVEVNELDHRACTGAKTAHMLEAWKANPRQIPYGVDSDVDVVVLTIGGNDLGFAGILADCVVGFTCADDPYSDGFESKLDKLYWKLVNEIYPELRRAYPYARIAHVGYPELFPRTNEVAVNCGWLTPEEQSATQSMLEKLNGTIWKATQDTASDVEFIDVADVLDGHELCTSDSWIYPVRSKWPSEQGHPIYEGQVAYARRVAATLGLTWLELPEF